MSRELRYASVTVLLVLVLAGLIGIRIYTLKSGFQIRLRTAPMNVEPLILGDEVEFDYEIARLNLTTLPGDNQFELWDTVYVKLGRLPNGEWVAQSTHRAMPPLTGYEVVLKGEVEEREYLENVPPPVLITKEIKVRYGIERYAVPRDKFDPLPPYGSPVRPVTVHAAVNPAGRAVITGVRVNNERYGEPIL
ncbi:MAG: GDYXXLXY domain-containing protein [Alphaproteobacteria bacterium]